jgi:hypothetical protein
MSLITHAFQERLSDARFADAWLARNEHHAALAALRLVPSAQECVDLLLTADEGRHGAAQRLKATVNCAQACHLPDLHWIAKALNRHESEIPVLEEPAKKAPGAVTNDHSIWLGQSLEPRRKVGGLAHHFVFLRRTTDRIADNHQTGGNANAHPQMDTNGSSQLRYRLDKTQPSMDGAFRIVLMRPGVTEIGKHTIAQISGDEAAGLVNLFSTAAVICANHLPQILWVKFCRECRRTDKVTKHNGKLATFGPVLCR